MNPQLNNTSRYRVRRMASYVAIVAFLIGGAGLIGWLFNIAPLKNVFVGLATMKVNTALAFMFAAAALWLGATEKPGRGRDIGRRLCAGMAALLGTLTLSEYMLGLNLGIDELFFKDEATPLNLFPGRMSLGTALNFTLLGTALLLLHTEGRTRGRISQLFTLLAGSIAGVALVGYGYDVQSLYRVGAYNSMALHTAFNFFLLANGILLAQPDRGIVKLFIADTLGGQSLRRLLPFFVGVPLALSLLVLLGEHYALYDLRVGLAVMVILNIVILTGALGMAARWLDRVDKDRQHAEMQIRVFARLYATLSQVNQTIVRVKDIPELFDAICKVAIEFGEFRLAWIGGVDHETGLIRCLAEHGAESNKFPFAEIKIHEAPFSHGLIHMALQSGEVECSNDIQTDPHMVHWRDVAIAGDYHAAAAIPIRQNNQIVAILNLYASDIHFFTTAAEKRLLDEMGLDISFALDAIQTETERSKTEQALRESEAALRKSQAIAHVGHWVWETRSNKLFWSEEMHRIFGIDPDTFDGNLDTVIAQVIHPDDRDIVNRANEAVLTAQQPAPLEYRVIWPDQSVHTIWVEPDEKVTDETGQIIRLSGIVQDITRRKQNERALREAHDFLEQRVQERTAEVQDLYDNAPAGYHSLDAAGNFVRVNQTELNWLGYTHEEMIGRMNFRDILTPASQKVFAENFPRFMKEGQINNLEFEMVRKNGTILPVAVNATTLYDADGNYIMSRSTVFDITERKQNEIRLRVANAELIRAATLKDEFLSSMSHELRTPLNGVLSLAEALEEGVYGELTPRQLNSLRVIAESGYHLLALINDILDLSKIEAGKMELQLAPVNVDQICQVSMRLIRSSALKKSLQLHYSYSSPVDELLLDARRLKQMLVNLLGNAVKFTPEGGQIGLEVGMNAAAEMIRFTVWDKGIGIAAAKLPLLFQPFSQLDSSLSRQYGGSGLGLSLVKRLAELHGGHVSVESEPDQGSRFHIDLPLSRLPLAEPAVGPQRQSTQDVRGKTALIVEDSETASAQLARYLHDLEMQVVIEAAGERTVEQTLLHQPHLILLDLLMPGMSGWDVLAALKTNPRTQTIPVIIVSVVDEQARGSAAGAAAHLVKPITREIFHHTVRSVLGLPANEVVLVADLPESAVADTPHSTDAAARILLAEDNAINQRSLNDYLIAKGYQVILATNGTEAIQQATQFKPDLILMDIQMPQMDGLEAIRRLRAMPRFATTPIIALTALAMPGDQERCLEAGANDYFTKPLSLKTLTKLIEMYLLPDDESVS